jgi:hypothetical protein
MWLIPDFGLCLRMPRSLSTEPERDEAAWTDFYKRLNQRELEGRRDEFLATFAAVFEMSSDRPC